MAGTEPIVYQVGPLSPSGTVQSAELRPEQLEQIPFPLAGSQDSADSNWPPVGFTETTSMATAIDTASNNTASRLPAPYNIEWVQGDSVEFQWLFTDVLWTDTDPGITDPTAPTWVETVWASEVRNPYLYATYAADYWVPAYGFQYNWWRGHSVVAQFDCISDVIEMPEVTPTQWATRVTMWLPAQRSMNILPGNWYRWDLQTRNPTTDPLAYDVDGVQIDFSGDQVRTRLRGHSRVITEWTIA